MPETIVFSPIPLDGEQRKRVESLFTQPGWVLLKEIIVANAIKRQVEAMNAGLYAEANNQAKADAQAAADRAARYSTTLDILDDLEQKEQEWFLAKLEARR
jgi:hypothetical protein